MEKNRKYDIFISYRRQGGDNAAKSIRDALDHRGYRVFFDVESLRSGNFNTKLFDVIDECSDFLLILSPGGMDRCANEDDWVRQEIEHALEKGKNIIPIMLRGFEFPPELPPSLEPVRFRNGLEANTQFFDAFIDRLCEFLKAKRRLTTRKIALIAAAAALCCALLAVGIFFMTRSGGGKAGADEDKKTEAVDDTEEEAQPERTEPYPSERAEVNLTNEVLYFMQMNLGQMNTMVGAARDAMAAGRRYLSAGSSDYQTVVDVFSYARISLTMKKQYPMTEAMRVDLADSPFSVADLTAFYDDLGAFSSDWQTNLDFFEQVLHADIFAVMPIEDKLTLFECYEEYLDAYVDAICCGVNDMLLPITQESAIEDFLYRFLPACENLPLRASGWIKDQKQLQDRMDEDFKKMEDVLVKISMLTGNFRNEMAKVADDDFSSYYPEEGDVFEILWIKLQLFVTVGRFEGIEKCIDAITETDEAKQYDLGPALYAFMDYMRSGGGAYGVMILAPYEPDGINEVYEVGDVIIAVNGQTCRTLEEYSAIRDPITEGEYTVTVLRMNGEGKMEKQDLTLVNGMPRVYMQSLCMSQE
ncbi:MAG: TIR domain-containing protein [Lachnospiraceae bacterium]|nr:TIR domain-containing protein [Lachnospiraceae bacterium]